ncbi:MAG: Thiol:disulfide interchange protein DsbD [Phycisphaerales bacterium]|nr:Thiol:disulfide interchange protein DsbD [Phycisphaerales bacterium]
MPTTCPYRPLALLVQGLAWLLILLITPLAAGQFGPPKVELSLVASKTQVRPGDQVVVAVIFNHQDGWHIHTNNPNPPDEWEGFEAIPTVIRPATESALGETAIPQPQLTFGPVQWPTPHTVDIDLGGTGIPLPYEVFEGRAIAYVPVIVSDEAPLGELSIFLDVGYQACDDSVCGMPVSGQQKVTLQVVAPEAAAAAAPRDPAVFGGFNSQVFSDLLAGKTVQEDLSFDLFGTNFFTLRGTNPLFLVFLLLAAALGGLILNLTPCVIPVIPIKIMSLSAAAGNPRRCFYLGIITSLGIIFFWLVIGACIAFIASFKQVNQLFQNPWFTLGVGGFVAVMALSMLGLYDINVPQWVYRFMPAANPKGKPGATGGSTSGTFLFGIFTAILSTPCTAPFMATASAWAARQPPALTLSTFAAIGIGMALPYAILSAFPSWIAKVPRSGPASILVKQVMGILMIGVAIFFLGTGLDPLLRLPVDPPIRFFWWIIALCVILAMVLLVVRTFQITTRPAHRAVWSVVGLAFTASGVWMAVHFTDRGPIPWVAYTPERFQEATSRGQVVVLDFTAEWCLNCKALEVGVLHRPEVVKALTADDVVPMRVDLTGKNEPGGEKLKSLNWVGIPLLAITGPGQPDPQKYDTYTTATVLDAISRARGAAAATPAPAASASPAVTDGATAPPGSVTAVDGSSR